MTLRPVLWFTLTLTAGPQLVGCYGSLDQLDQQAAEMIAHRQALVLGQHGQIDASVTPADEDWLNSSNLYSELPPTNNPEAGALNTRAMNSDRDIAIDHGSQSADPNAVPIELDLSGLLAMAIRSAPEYRSQKEDLFLSTLALIIERHEWGPRFFNTLSANLSGTPESGDFDTALDLVNNFRVTQRLPYGGTASVQALVNYTTLLQQASTNTGPDETQSAAINASIDLPLLRGSGMVARESMIQAERDLVYAARDFERFRREFFVDIANTYFDLLRQQNGILNQQLQLEGLKALSQRLTAEVDRGRTPQFEADDAEAQVLFGESNLIRAQDNYQTALDRLKIQIGIPTTVPLVIVRAQIEIPTPALDEQQAVPTALSNRLDLQTTRDRVDDSRRSARVSRNQLMGDLDLSADLTLNTDRDDDIDGLDFELEDSSYALGLSYDAPIDRRIELAQYRRSLVLLERAQRNYRVTRDQVALDVRDAIREIDRSRLTLQLQERNIEFAERRLEGIRIRVQREPIEPRRLIEAEEDLLDARNRRDEALADLQASVLQYLLVTGQMRVGPDGGWLAPGELVADPPADEADTDDLDADPPDVPAQPGPADNEPAAGE
ncbi:MAG: TolC family protein [Phycisphaerales bacterium JB063]